MEAYPIVNARTWRAWKEFDRVVIMESDDSLPEKSKIVMDA